MAMQLCGWYVSDIYQSAFCKRGRYNQNFRSISDYSAGLIKKFLEEEHFNALRKGIAIASEISSKKVTLNNKEAYFSDKCFELRQ